MQICRTSKADRLRVKKYIDQRRARSEKFFNIFLLALYLASPEGAKFTLEEAGIGNLYYPGNFQHDIRVQNQMQGIREIFSDRNTDLLEFYDSKEASQLQKEMQILLQTGGKG